ncbi:hypothetical protein ABZT10_41020, partial [Streptomyces sp900116325]
IRAPWPEKPIKDWLAGARERGQGSMTMAQRVLGRMDAMLSGTDDQDRPVAYNRVAGVVVTGNEGGAHHVVSEIGGALGGIGYNIPGQAWTCWHLCPGPVPNYLDDVRGHEWSHKTTRPMANNLYGTARALAASPIGAPPPMIEW